MLGILNGTIIVIVGLLVYIHFLNSKLDDVHQNLKVCKENIVVNDEKCKAKTFEELEKVKFDSIKQRKKYEVNKSDGFHSIAI